MIRGRRSRMVERYLSGSLEGSDLQGFLRKVGRDTKLRELLEEERAIQRTLSRDSAAVPTIGIEFPERLSQMLIANPAPQSGKSNQGGGTGVSAENVAAGGLNHPMMRVFFTAFCIIAVIILALFVVSKIDFGHSTPSASASGVGSPVQGTGLPEPLGTGSHAGGLPIRTDTSVSSGVPPRIEQEDAAGGGISTSPHAGAAMPKRSSTADSHADRRPSSNEVERSMQNSLDREERRGSGPVVRHDSVARLNVKLK
jgi:hypothetical protein